MKRLGVRLAGLLRGGAGRCPADRVLALFLTVLLAQSAYSLFAGAGRSGESGHIDVIVRTASAAIFGYFLSGPEGDTPEERRACRRLRTAWAAGVGLFCLGVLVLLRDAGPAVSTASATATVAQFRDFISGCVGFLIGAPPAGKRDG